MKITLQFIADYLKANGFNLFLYQRRARSLKDVRMLRSVHDTELNTEYAYVLRPSKLEAVVDCSQNYILLGGDDSRFGEADRIVLPDGSASEVYETVLDMFSKIHTWCMALQDSIISGGSIQNLLELSGGIFCDNPISVVSPSLLVLGYMKNSGKEDFMLYCKAVGDRQYISEEKTPNLQAEVESRTSANKPNPYFEYDSTYNNSGTRVLRSTAFSGNGCPLAWITIAQYDKPLFDYHRELICFLTECVRDILERDDYFFRSNETVSPEFLIDVLLGHSIGRSLTARNLSLINWEMDDAYSVLVIKTRESAKYSQETFRYFSRIFPDLLPRSRALSIAGATVVICNSKKAPPIGEAAMEKLLAFLRLNDAICGCSMTFCDFTDIASYYQQALFALSRVKKQHYICLYDECLTEHMVEIFLNKYDFRNFIHPGIARLSDFDAKYEGDLVETLYTYLIYDHSHIASSEKLHIHRSTFRYRINKIKDLIGVDYNDPEIKLNLLISAYMCLKKQGK